MWHLMWLCFLTQNVIRYRIGLRLVLPGLKLGLKDSRMNGGYKLKVTENKLVMCKGCLQPTFSSFIGHLHRALCSLCIHKAIGFHDWQSYVVPVAEDLVQFKAGDNYYLVFTNLFVRLLKLSETLTTLLWISCEKGTGLDAQTGLMKANNKKILALWWCFIYQLKCFKCLTQEM